MRGELYFRDSGDHVNMRLFILFPPWFLPEAIGRHKLRQLKNKNIYLEEQHILCPEPKKLLNLLMYGLNYKNYTNYLLICIVNAIIIFFDIFKIFVFNFVLERITGFNVPNCARNAVP